MVINTIYSNTVYKMVNFLTFLTSILIFAYFFLFFQKFKNSLPSMTKENKNNFLSTCMRFCFRVTTIAVVVYNILYNCTLFKMLTFHYCFENDILGCYIYLHFLSICLSYSLSLSYNILYNVRSCHISE